MPSGHRSLKKFAPLAIILGIAVGGFILLVATRPTIPPISSNESVWPVRVETITTGEHTPLLTLFGRVTAPVPTRLMAAINATINDVPVNEGDEVHVGQRLVRLDDTEFQLHLKQREAEYRDALAQLQNEIIRHKNDQRILTTEKELVALAQQALERAKSLQRSKLASETHIDETRQILARQRIELEQRQRVVDEHPARQVQLEALITKTQALRDLARLDLERTHIDAPFAARITQVLAAPGSRTRPGDVVIELYAPGALEIRAQIPSTRLNILRSMLNSGISLRATPVAFDTDKETSFRLLRLSGEIRPGSGGLDGIFSIESDIRNYVQGQVIKLHLQLAPVTDAISLPMEALYGTERIYRIRNKRLQTIRVEHLGITYNSDGHERAIVRSAELKSGNQILTTQLPNAIDGLKVRVLQ
jgi:multidrug efflux pump subunit AcrA (membrane-fusion protein)